VVVIVLNAKPARRKLKQSTRLQNNPHLLLLFSGNVLRSSAWRELGHVVREQKELGHVVREQKELGHVVREQKELGHVVREQKEL
jgi:hypothetical protein